MAYWHGNVNLEVIIGWHVLCIGPTIQMGRQSLRPLNEFLGVFGYLIENQYKVEHFKSTSV
jgi:hypothetical protein